MGSKRKYDYPDRDELIQLLAEHGQYGAAERIGCSRSTLQHHLRREGITTDDYQQVESWAARKKTLPAADDQVSEAEMLRQELGELKSKLRKDRKESVYEERLTRAVEIGLRDSKPKYSPRAIPKSKKKLTTHEFVLDWSDLHAGEVVSLEETSGLNKYNWEIMLDRLDKLRTALFSYQDNRPYPVKKLYLFALGDMLSGNIHPELMATNEFPLQEVVTQLAEDGAVWIESLTERFEEIEVHGVVGNHPRGHKKPWFKQGYDNADWTVYHIWRSILARNPRIRFDIPKSSQHRVIVAENHPNLIFHGDGIPSGHQGVPWGGVMRRIQKYRNEFQAAGMPVEYFHCGHFHVANAVEQGRLIMNGSVIGLNEFSIKKFGYGFTPVQALSTFHPTKGLTDVSFLDCI